jgi:hypothetical protein
VSKCHVILIRTVNTDGVIFLRSIFIIIFCIFISPIAGACEMAADHSFLWTLPRLVHESTWIVIGTAKAKSIGDGAWVYRITAREMLKGKKEASFQTEPFELAKDEQMPTITKDCLTKMRLRTGKSYIFFQVTANALSVQEVTAQHRRQIQETLASGVHAEVRRK